MSVNENIYQKYLDGDQDALYDLVENYKNGLVLYLSSIVNDFHTAEDLMVDTFTKLIIKKPRYLGKSGFKTWLYAIGRNVALDTLRKNKTVDITVEDSEKRRREERALEKEYLEQERKIILHNAMRKLPPEYRRVLHLKFFENFSTAEIALILNKSEHQTGNLIHRAKKSLKSELDKAGFEYEEL